MRGVGSKLSLNQLNQMVLEKTQTTSTKLQINLKFQYPMIKTFTVLVSHYITNPDPPVMMLLGTTVDGSFVLNFEFKSLGFIWDLVFGAWNFHDLSIRK